MTTPTRPIEYRRVAVHMTQAIAAQLRGGIAQCQLVGLPVTDQMDLELIPFWKVPPSWSTYTVHLLDSERYTQPPFNPTTMRWTIDSNAITLNSITANGTPYFVSNYWSTHPEYNSNDDTHTLNATFVLVLNGQLGSAPQSATEQVFSVVIVQRTPRVSLQSYTTQSVISITTSLIALICGIIGSIELYLGIQKRLENDLIAQRDYYLLSVDIFKTLSLSRHNRPIPAKDFLEKSYNTYQKLIESSDTLARRIDDQLIPLELGATAPITVSAET